MPVACLLMLEAAIKLTCQLFSGIKRNPRKGDGERGEERQFHCDTKRFVCNICDTAADDLSPCESCCVLGPVSRVPSPVLRLCA